VTAWALLVVLLATTGAVWWLCFLVLSLLIASEVLADRSRQARRDDHTPDLDQWADELAAMNQERTDRP
jgi:hypothetical protein